MPGDIVSNAIIVSTVYGSTMDVGGFSVFHSTTSSSNPITAWKFYNNGAEYVAYHPFTN